MEIDFFTLALVVAFLLLVSAISSIVFKKIKIPYTIGLVVVGIALSYIFSHYFPKMETMHSLKLTTDLIMYMLLPVLIFDAAVNIDIKLFIKNLVPALVLAGPGLVIATLITAVIMSNFSPLSIGSAMVFGALISATDPVAVISLFELVGAPKRLSALVDGESLFNDATAIVMFNIVLAIVTSGVAVSFGTIFHGVIDFVLVFVGGFLVGGVLGYLFMHIIKFAKNDPLIVVGLSIVLAFCSFIISDKVFHFSGVMSSVGAGVMVSYFSSSRFDFNVSTYMKQFWSLMSFIANSVIFLLLGFTEELMLLGTSLKQLIVPILVAILAIQVARIVVVFGICPIFGIKNSDKKISWAYKMVMFWGGLRGAVPLALVFGLPATLENRELLVQITLGVVLFTLLVQGTTIQSMLSHYKLDRPESFTLFSKKFSLVALRRRTLEIIKSKNKNDNADKKIVEESTKEYELVLENSVNELKEFIAKESDNGENSFNKLVWNVALASEKVSYNVLYHSKFCSESVFRKLLFSISNNKEEIDWNNFDTKLANAQPIELVAKNKIFLMLEKFSVANKILASYHKQIVIDDYFMLASLLYGGRRAIEAIEGMVELAEFKEYDKERNICKEFYKKREEKILAEFDKMHIKYSEFSLEFEKYIFRQGICVAELNELYKLEDSGETTEEVAESIIEMLEDYEIEILANS